MTRPGYGWEPLPLYDFLQGMRVARPGDGRRFLDVGSGVGEKLKLAHMLGWEPEGVEINPILAGTSREMWPYPVTVADAFDYDGYGEFDLVYCYAILIERDDQMELHHHVTERMRPGALYFAAGGPDPDWLENIGGQVWRTR